MEMDMIYRMSTLDSLGNRERWHLAKIDDLKVKALADKLDIEFILAKILLVRQLGKGALLENAEFLKPSDDLLYKFDEVSSPEHLEKAVRRVRQAVEAKETIMINGDPDADGISGTTVLVCGLRHLGLTVDYEFPARGREGHGVQVRIIDQCIERGIKLIITTDCGSKDIEAIQYASDQGVDVIVTDHHILGKTLPPAYAVINPNMVEGPSAFKCLSGGSVSLKFIQAVYDCCSEELPAELFDFMTAVAALGTISDRMSMLDLMNRRLVQYGVQCLQTTQREGLKALKRSCGETGNSIKPRDLSRSIVPRLNAPGRIGDKEKGIPDASVVVDLLMIGIGKENEQKATEAAEAFESLLDLKAKKDKELNKELDREAISSAASVDDVNERRKFITNKIEEEIDKFVESYPEIDKERVIIIEGHNWNAGVIGIDTDRLKERFLRPAVILTKYNNSEYLRGSVRSIPKINMYRVIDEVGEQFLQKYDRQLYRTKVESKSGDKLVNAFGGHSQACGFCVHEDDKEIFKSMVKQEVDKLPEEQFEYSYEIIDKLPFTQLNAKFMATLDKLVPFGQNFDFPIFYLTGCGLTRGRSFGNKYQETRKPHVQFKVIENPKREQNRSLLEFDAVGFGLWEKFCDLLANSTSKARFDVIFTLEKNFVPKKKSKFKRSEFRLNVLDIRVSGKNVDSFLIPEDD
jgi:single-stranded-DNA-specific exonuclease